ncbi:MAG: hypothetical protein B6D55_02425 [Candidatus Omnitrophica bacterium 4484_70.2]|nr:MAG: hypothetical protein B6D55_02425 [Candidatus Omnitrophica bacterium 4484_70.2]
MNRLQELLGKFTPLDVVIDEVLKRLDKILYKSRFPNEIAKFTVDLSIERDKKKLSSIGGGEGLFDYNAKYPSWHYLKVLIKGDGVWTLTFELAGKRTISLTNEEILRGDEIFLEFYELYFTNEAQTGVVNPVFWIEKRYNV